ncbi:Lsr2 family DNA-binding protein [Microbacterium dauci]|uniref:Lsr2 family protein n=1 Tax=Microbacterium dauci TaxID=3048008 RepID=A0ABT6ZAM0_9MICO|nr:histone-like nucleoid-structuring protein Lsr2 [Microbacterium sp. LX3-4]MDJ1113215.1 Lsr2 family protein [Microbacterium sp. LX3-4]
MIDLPADVEHGTPEGFAAGCKKDTDCPALREHGLACVYAHVRAQTDFRYFKAKARDPRPAAIARALGITPPAAADTAKLAEADAKRPRRQRPVTNQSKTAVAPSPAPENTPTPEEHEMPTSEEPTSTPTIKPTPPTPPKRTPPAPTPPSGRSREELADIRLWARSNGYDVASHGRVPVKVIEAYDAAHSPVKPEPQPVAAEAAADFEPIPGSMDNGDGSFTHPGTDTPLEEADVVDETDGAEIGEYDYAAASDKLDETRERAGISMTSITGGATIDDPAPVIDSVLAHLKVPRGVRPAWADVAISEDVERARALAAHLEAENAVYVSQLDTIGTALETALRAWATATERLAEEQRRSAVASRLRSSSNRHLLEKIQALTAQLGAADTTIERLNAAAEDDGQRITDLVNEVDRLSARRWWQFGGAR